MAAPAGFARAAAWVGSYRVSVLGGYENTSWTLDHVPAGPCDAPVTGSGTDDTTFFSGEAVTTELIGTSARALNWRVLTLELAYTENRQGSTTSGTPADTNPADCPAAARVLPAPAGATDCGLTHERTHIDAGLDPSAPLLRQHYTGVHFDSPYVNCPVAGVVPPQFAAPLTAHLPPLGTGGPRTATASLTAEQPIATPGYAGSTQLDLRLSIRRLVAVDAMRLHAGARPPVRPGGRLTLPLSCPSAAPCHGSVALTVGVRSAPAAYQLAPASGGNAVAVARFRLPAGGRGVQVTLPGGRALTRRLARRRVDVVITEGSGARTVTYDVGTVRL